VEIGPGALGLAEVQTLGDLLDREGGLSPPAGDQRELGGGSVVSSDYGNDDIIVKRPLSR
jgi:hypothetical protein